MKDEPILLSCEQWTEISANLTMLRTKISELEAEVARYDCRRAGKYYETSGSHCPLDKPCFRCRAEAAEAKVADLAEIVKHLCRALKRTQHNSDFDPGLTIDKAMDFLKRKDLLGSILRQNPREDK